MSRPGRTSVTRIVCERPGRAMSLIADGAPANTVRLRTPLRVPGFTLPSRTYDAYAGRGADGIPATARNDRPSDPCDVVSADAGLSAPPPPAFPSKLRMPPEATAPASAIPDPVPTNFRNFLRSIGSMSIPSVRRPQIREMAQVVRVRPDLVRRHCSIRHEPQLDIDHVVRELPSIQEARGAREVVRQDVREEDLRDARCLRDGVATERHER